MRVHLHGMGIAGRATLAALAQGSHSDALDAGGLALSISDDAPGTDDSDLHDLADRFGAEVIPSADLLGRIGEIDQLIPAPGVPEGHAVIEAALHRGCEVVSEIEVAYRIEQSRPGGPRPMIAITGTDGKTTTCALATEMLRAAGVRAAAVGNTETPLIAALDEDLEVFVVECSSFRLAWTHRFRAEAAVWVNLAPDHLNWHRSLDSYIAAKARIFNLQSSHDVAIANAQDPIVMRELARATAISGARTLRFGAGPSTERNGVEYWSDGSQLWGPEGVLCAVGDMWRQLPHDQTNALAAAAAVLEIGAGSAAAIRAAVGAFPGVPHRIEFIGEIGGTAWYNDSKATTPHAAAAAIAGFPSVVLIAGGRNKDLDLSSMRSPGRVRAVVAIGEAADEIAAVFAQDCPVHRATSMPDAVRVAAEVAGPTDVVLLSPGCASFDWYPHGGYEARGDHFRDLVRAVINTSSTPHGDH